MGTIIGATGEPVVVAATASTELSVVNATSEVTIPVAVPLVPTPGGVTAPLIKATEQAIFGDLTLSASDGVIGGTGTVNLPLASSQPSTPQAFVISAYMGDITVVPHVDDEVIFTIDNDVTAELVVPSNTAIVLLRYVGVWRVVFSSAGGGSGDADLVPRPLVVSRVVTGDVNIATLEAWLAGGFPEGSLFGIGLAHVASTPFGLATLGFGGTVTGGDGPGVYEWDGATLTIIPGRVEDAMARGDLVAYGGIVIDDTGATVVDLNPYIGAILPVDFGGGPIPVFGGAADSAQGTVVDTTNFGGLLSPADDTVQKALDTLDDHVHRSVGWAVAAHAPVGIELVDAPTEFSPGASFDGDTLTSALAYTLPGVVAGAAILLSNQTDPANDGIWTATGGDEFTRGEVIVTTANEGKLVTAGFDAAASASVVMQITGGALAYLYVTEAAVEAKVDTLIGEHDTDPAAHDGIEATVDALAAAVNSVAGIGNNRALWAAPADDVEALESTEYVIRCDGVQGWYSNVVGGLGDTPLGLDIRCKLRPRRPDNFPIQSYMEILTQPNPLNHGGDNFEAALVINRQDSEAANGHPVGAPFMFWEHTPDRTLFFPTVDGEVGTLADPADFVDGDPGPANRGVIPKADAGVVFGEWATLRWLLDTTTETLSMYREIGYGIELDGAWDDVAAVSHTADGRAWYLLDSWTYPYAGSMEPGITELWEIGLRFLGDFAWFEAYHGPDGDPLIDIQPSHIAAAGLGAQSLTDGLGTEWIGPGLDGNMVARLNPVTPVKQPIAPGARFLVDTMGRPVARQDGTAGLTQAITVGQTRLVYGDLIDPAPPIVEFLYSVTASGLQPGEAVNIVCYHLDDDGLPGALAWSQEHIIGTSTGDLVAIADFDLHFPDRYFIGMHNPLTNSGTITVRAMRPVEGPFTIGSAATSYFTILTPSSIAPHPHFDGFVVNSAPNAADRFGLGQDAPQILVR